MRHFDHHAVGVSNGAVDLFSAFEDGGPMWSGQGPRLETFQVAFPEAFVEPPVVHLSLGMWDIGVNGNQRVDLKATLVTVEGFQIEFRTWGDTRVARVRANWLAIGPVRYRDDFEA
nr:H-type lectin domain-containing protein [Paracoccus laeviglucosivorans]